MAEQELNMIHPFDKASACEFIQNSCMDGWLKSVCISRILEEDTANNPRFLAKLIGTYLEMGLKPARTRNDYETICGYCKMGFDLRDLLFNKSAGLMQCKPECEYLDKGYSIPD